MEHCRFGGGILLLSSVKQSMPNQMQSAQLRGNRGLPVTKMETGESIQSKPNYELAVMEMATGAQ